MFKALRNILPLLLCASCTLPQAVRNTDIPDSTGGPLPTRIGVASSTTWFWVWQTGDSSVPTAQQNGGIEEVSSITKTTNSYLGIVKRHITTVRGN